MAFHYINEVSTLDKKENNFRFLLLFGFIFLIGSFLRLYNISRDSLILDEAQSVWQASHSFIYIRNYMAQNVHLPLHNTILRIWMMLFGSSQTILRTFSAIPGILTLPAIYLLAKEVLGDRGKSLFIMFIAAISPFWIWFSREIRMYSLLALITTLSYYFYLKLLRRFKVSTLTIFTIVNLIGIYTHYFFDLILFIEGVYFFLSYFLNWYPETKYSKRKLLFGFIVSGLILVLAFIPWILFYMKENMGGELSPALDKPASFDIVLSLFQFTLGYQTSDVSTTVISFWPIICLFAFAFLTKRDKLVTPPIYLIFIGTFFPIIIVYIASILYKPIYLTRYLIGTTPLYIIFLSWIISEMRGAFKYLSSTLLIGAMIFAVYNQYTNPNIPEKENYRDAVNYVTENATARDIVLVSPPYTLFPVQYYYTGNSRLETLPIWDRSQLNLPTITTERLTSDIEYLRTGHQRIFLIDTLNLAGGYDIQNYLDHHYTRLDFRSFSKYIWVFVYQAEYAPVAAESSLSKSIE